MLLLSLINHVCVSVECGFVCGTSVGGCESVLIHRIIPVDGNNMGLISISKCSLPPPTCVKNVLSHYCDNSTRLFVETVV